MIFVGDDTSSIDTLNVDAWSVFRRKLHDKPSSAQLRFWHFEVQNYMPPIKNKNPERWPYDYTLDGLTIKMYTHFNWPVEEHAFTKLRLALVCLHFAVWPEGFDQPSMIDAAAFAAASDYSGDPYLAMYTHLLLEYPKEVIS